MGEMRKMTIYISGRLRVKPDLVEPAIYKPECKKETKLERGSIHVLASLQLLASVSVKCLHSLWRARFWRHEFALRQFGDGNVKTGASKPGNE